MRATKPAAVLAAFVVCLSVAAVAQETVDLSVVDRIKAEATARSRVMDLLRELTDVHGPRLTASPGFDDAAKWAVERLTGFGISNVRLDRWGPFGRSWSADSASVEMLAPRYARLMQASAVIASVVYSAANRPEWLPRRDMPAAPGPR